MSKRGDRIVKYSLITIFSSIIIVSSFIIVFLVSGGTLFRALKIRETDVLEQIALEKSALNTYLPILKYIEDYKLKSGSYPHELTQNFKDIVSKKFDGFEYYTTRNGNYILRIFPKQGPIEYYQPRKLYHWRTKSKGMEDGILDNEYYYNIDENWQAIHYQYYTRYNDSEVDIYNCYDNEGRCWDYTRHRCEMHDLGFCYKDKLSCDEDNGIWQNDKKYCKLK